MAFKDPPQTFDYFHLQPLQLLKFRSRFSAYPFIISSHLLLVTVLFARWSEPALQALNWGHKLHLLRLLFLSIAFLSLLCFLYTHLPCYKVFQEFLEDPCSVVNLSSLARFNKTKSCLVNYLSHAMIFRVLSSALP